MSKKRYRGAGVLAALGVPEGDTGRIGQRRGHGRLAYFQLVQGVHGLEQGSVSGAAHRTIDEFAPALWLDRGQSVACVV